MEHITIVMVFAFAAVVAGALLSIPLLIAPRQVTAIKSQPFESGKDPFKISEGRFAIKFSTIAIFFILFDIEIMMLWPWAVQFRSLGLRGLVVSMVFLGILMFGYFYIWRKGGLEWE